MIWLHLPGPLEFDYCETMSKTAAPLVQLSERGQITLPDGVRHELGLHGGDALRVRIEDGRIVLEPVEVVEVERYTEARIREFEKTGRMSPDDLAEARRRWGL